MIALVAVVVTAAAAQAHDRSGAADDVRAERCASSRARESDARHLRSPRDHHGAGHELFIEVPLDYSTGVVFPFGGSHHTVPGVVAVNRAPHLCVVHARAFRDRAGFVGHLRMRHGLVDAEMPGAVLVDGGQVRYLGD